MRTIHNWDDPYPLIGTYAKLKGLHLDVILYLKGKKREDGVELFSVLQLISLVMISDMLLCPLEISLSLYKQILNFEASVIIY